MIPSDAEKLDLENKISAASQAKWKVRIETAIEDLEASKLSVHNLLQDNLCLKTLLQHSAEENERVQEETELKYQKRVNIWNAPCCTLVRRGSLLLTYFQISALEKQSRLLESAGHPKIASLEQEINNLAKENAKSKSKIKVTD